jgi:hypothetical protein
VAPIGLGITHRLATSRLHVFTPRALLWTSLVLANLGI